LVVFTGKLKSDCKWRHFPQISGKLPMLTTHKAAKPTHRPNAIAFTKSVCHSSNGVYIIT